MGSVTSLAVEIGDRVDDVLELPLVELGIYRQRQRLGGRALGFRVVPWLVAEVGKAFLHVQGHGVIDLRADSALTQVGTQAIPVRYTYHVLVVYMAVARTSGRCDDLGNSCTGERAIVIGSVALPCAMPFFQVPELHAQNRRLNLVDAEVAADHRVVVLGLPAVHAQDSEPGCEGIVVRHAHTGVAERPKVLGWKEGQAADVADAAR